MRVKLLILGIVQGVGFRPFIYRTAVKSNLMGYVRNRGDAGVEVLLEGEEKNIDKFVANLSAEKPPLAQIDRVTRTYLTGNNQYDKFTIYPSSTQAETCGSIIPPDISICNSCLAELRDSQNPRNNYFFITCTDCGPRFTIIKRLPYDRKNTTMIEFPLCGFCKKEYEDPTNRRFQAQTVACPICGPKAYLTNNLGEPIETTDPVRLAGKLLSEGKILAIKGYGGFHIAASTTLEQPLMRLRNSKHRGEKPFAIMAKNLGAVQRFGEVSLKEEGLLASPQRPIVLINKNENYNLSPLVAPHLHNIGVMLPYTALHYMLFDEIIDTTFVMTSANPANMPIVKDNEDALKILRDTVDYFLFHNRKIAHRCDDSVMRLHGPRPIFLRRSRGYSPVPIRLKMNTKRCTLGLGGELNNTSTILIDDKAFISQHIGDVENIETQAFLEEATVHLQHLTNTNPEVVACDLHPKFNTTRLAHEIADAKGLPILQVQHHHAHAMGLMAEHGLEDMVVVACDGYGYGSDGGAWGGEILHCTSGSTKFKRMAHLEAQPLLGGDLASRYPMRVAAGILNKAGEDAETWLLENSLHLPHGAVEAKLIANQLKTGRGTIETTSCGRVLDAAAAVLGVCFMRSYEGEPAMKLESIALQGKDVLHIKPRINGDILSTTTLMEAIYDNLGRVSVSDLAYSAHSYLAEGLAELVLQKAAQQGVVNVGFTGGVACNQLFTEHLRVSVENAGLRFFVHEAVPAGDGGISFGQAVAASFSDF